MKRHSNIIRLLTAALLLVAGTVWGQAQTKAIPEDPKVPHFITLIVKGEGKLTGKAVEQGIDLPVGESKFTDLPHAAKIALTAIPGEGQRLVSVTATLQADSTATERELLKSPVSYPDTATCNFLLESNTLVRAFFEKMPVSGDTVIIEEKDTVIGGDTPAVLEQLVINGKSENEITTVTLRDVTIQNSEESATTTVTKNSNVILELSGEVNMDKLVNNGNLLIRNAADEPSALSYKSVENNGALIDETGQITTVEGDAALEITHLEDQEIAAGGSVTLTAKANPSESYHLTFLWERLQGEEWKQAAEPEVFEPNSLRSEEAITSRLEVRASEAGLYRCTITNQVSEVSTTLRTFAEVTVKSDPTPDPTPDPDPDPDQPTSVTEVSGNALRIWGADGTLHIHSPKSQPAYVITSAGQLREALTLPEGETTLTLPRGIYIIRVGEQATKIRL